MTLTLFFSSLIWLFSYYEKAKKFRKTEGGWQELACILPLIIGLDIFGYILVAYLYGQG